MNSPTITIITPTLGRPTLSRMLQSVLPQLAADDEWLIVGDGSLPETRLLLDDEHDRRIEYFEWHDARSAFGNAQRNIAMQRARKDLLLFVDDDDWLLPDALAAVRREGVHGVPMMFRMEYLPKRCVLWRVPILREANVGGGMFVIPNRKDRIAVWPIFDDPRAQAYGASDFTFVQNTLQKWPADSLRWCREVIYCCPRHGKGK